MMFLMNLDEKGKQNEDSCLNISICIFISHDVQE